MNGTGGRLGSVLMFTLGFGRAFAGGDCLGRAGALRRVYLIVIPGAGGIADGMAVYGVVSTDGGCTPA